jgi:hypothetical protein
LGVRDFVLAEFDLQIRQAAAHGMERDAVVKRWIEIVGLVVANNDVCGAAQGN